MEEENTNKEWKLEKICAKNIRKHENFLGILW